MLDKLNEYKARREADLQAANILSAVDQQSMSTTISGDGAPVATGELLVEIRDVDKDGTPDGGWRTHEHGKNLVVTQAQNLMPPMAAGTANAALNYIELGNPVTATAPALTDTTLQTTTGQRIASTITTSSNKLTAVSTWGTAVGNGNTYTEAGLFTGPFSTGTMFARKTFSGITKTSAFELKLTWIVTFVVASQGTGDCGGVALVGPSTVTNETTYTAVAGVASLGMTFDFTVGAAHLDVFLNGLRLVRGVQYTEVAAGSLTAPIGANPLNKGINFVGFTLSVSDKVYVVHRLLA